MNSTIQRPTSFFILFTLKEGVQYTAMTVIHDELDEKQATVTFIHQDVDLLHANALRE